MARAYSPWGALPIAEPAGGPPVACGVPPSAYAILQLVAAHDDVSCGELIARLVCLRAREIGLAALVDEHERQRYCCHGNSRGESGHG